MWLGVNGTFLLSFMIIRFFRLEIRFLSAFFPPHRFVHFTRSKLKPRSDSRTRTQKFPLPPLPPTLFFFSLSLSTSSLPRGELFFPLFCSSTRNKLEISSEVASSKYKLIIIFHARLFSLSSQISSLGDSKVPRSINKAPHRWYVIANGNAVTVDWRHYGFHTSAYAGCRIRLRLELCTSFFVLAHGADDNRWVALTLIAPPLHVTDMVESEDFMPSSNWFCRSMKFLLESFELLFKFSVVSEWKVLERLRK